MTLVSKTITASQVELNASGHRHRFNHLIGDYGLTVVFLICFVLLSIGTTSFLTVGNLINVIRQSSIIGFIEFDDFCHDHRCIDLSVDRSSA